MNQRMKALAVALAVLAIPATAAGQSFEGVLKERIIELDDQVLFEMMSQNAYDEPEFDSEAAWFRFTAEKLLAMPLHELASVQDARVEEVTLYIKGQRIRYGGTSSDGYMIMDLESMTTMLVMPEERRYIEYNLEDAEAAAEAAAEKAEDMMRQMGIDPEELAAAAEYEDEEYDEGMDDGVDFPSRVTSLGRTEEVNGFRAEAFAGEAGQEIGLAWCAEDVTGMRKAMERLGAQLDMDEEEEYDEGPTLEDAFCATGLPVRSQIVRLDGTMGGLWYNVQEILSLERTSVPDDRFEVPAGYEKVSLEDMWR